METHERVENRLKGASVDVGIPDRRRMQSSKEKEWWTAAPEVEIENQIYLGSVERSRFGGEVSSKFEFKFEVCETDTTGPQITSFHAVLFCYNMDERKTKLIPGLGHWVESSRAPLVCTGFLPSDAGSEASWPP